MKGSNTFEERMSVSIGESLFQQWCDYRGYKWHRLGLTGPTVDGFKFMNPLLRNIPDYFVETTNGCRVVQVKGTFNIKQSEYNMLDEFISVYSSPDAPLFYAFCIRDKHPLLLSATELKRVYEESTPDRQWDDGKVYRNLNLWATPISQAA